MIVSKKQINWPKSILKCRELAIHFSVEYVCDFVYQVNATYISVLVRLPMHLQVIE